MNITDLSVHQSIIRYLQEQGITQLTDIQAKTIPHLVSHRGDVHGQAQTGTGKTLAFLLPLLERVLASSSSRVTGLVVSPTRELALQIAEVAQPLAHTVGASVVTVYGGVSIEDQMRKLRKGADIVIGTPGRLRDHLSRGTLKLDKLKTLVLDEADIMLDMGFREEIEKILSYAPDNREIWLFSATVKEGITHIKQNYMHDPQSFAAQRQAVTSELTQQYFCVVPHKARVRAICRFIEAANDFYGLIFCQTKLLTQEVAEKLNRYGYHVGALHGDMTQKQRNVVTRKFRDKKLSVLVATDVAARGIDIQDITHVINYSFPEDHESYVHRIGRTGRAGKYGTAITFIDKKEMSVIRQVQKKFKVQIEPIDVPSTQDLIDNRVASIRDTLTRTARGDKDCPQLHDMIADMSDENVRSALYHVLYDQYIAPIASESISSMSAEEVKSEFATKELSLSVGSLDGVDRHQVTSHILSHAGVSEKQLKKVRVIQRKTFIDVPSRIAESVKKAVERTRLAGRTLRVHFVE